MEIGEMEGYRMSDVDDSIETDLANVPKSKHKTYLLTLRYTEVFVLYLELMANMNDPLQIQSRSEEEEARIRKKYEDAKAELKSLGDGISGLKNIEEHGTPH